MFITIRNPKQGKAAKAAKRTEMKYLNKVAVEKILKTAQDGDGQRWLSEIGRQLQPLKRHTEGEEFELQAVLR